MTDDDFVPPMWMAEGMWTVYPNGLTGPVLWPETPEERERRIRRERLERITVKWLRTRVRSAWKILRHGEDWE